MHHSHRRLGCTNPERQLSYVRPQCSTWLVGLRAAYRNSLLVSTALISSFCFRILLVPSHAFALDCTGDVGQAIKHTSIDDFITCLNTISRRGVGVDAISLSTAGPNHFISLTNTATSILDGDGFGILTSTTGGHSPIIVNNAGPIHSVSEGIAGFTGGLGGESAITIINSGYITSGFDGIRARTLHDNSGITAINSGSISAGDQGIELETLGRNSPLGVTNRAPLATNSDSIVAATHGDHSGVVVNNSSRINSNYGGVVVETHASHSGINVTNVGQMLTYVDGINATTRGESADIMLSNAGAIANSYDGIDAETRGDRSAIVIVNSGSISAGPNALDSALEATASGEHSLISIVNSGRLLARDGIFAGSYGSAGRINVDNSGDILSSSAGIYALARGIGSDVAITNSSGVDAPVGILAAAIGNDNTLAIENAGKIEASHLGIGIFAYGYGTSILVNNIGPDTTVGGTSGAFNATSLPINLPRLPSPSIGIAVAADGARNSITIDNSSALKAFGSYGIAIAAATHGPSSPITIVNSNALSGGFAGILTASTSGTTIVNAGNISAGSQFAIGVYAGGATILNAGRITGFVVLDADDTFINEKGGVFETKLASDFGPGSDLFRNEAGGTVLDATDPKVIEQGSFINLERFENQGLITLQDGQAGDSFEISNTVGGRDLKFIGSGRSTLAVDSFLGGPGSISDTFTVNGDVSGETEVKVNNTNHGLGVYNKQGISVVYVNGATPNGNEFFLPHPINTGFFDYDLFFKPTDSGVFELKSFLGQGAFVLPQLITAAQDMWHSGSSTWFDRTADLRVLLNGGAAPAEDAEAKYAEGAPQAPQNFTPAVWARGSGNWLNRDDSENVSAYGRDYRYNLNRNLETVDFQSGIDLGRRGLFSDNDILVFGALGGFIHSDLDYDAINRLFNFEGGQVGGYATYLRGGLFVDTLVNVHLMQIDTRTLGFPNSMNATTVGVRTDSGYRFGSFHGGAFIEPLATISATWADIDGFTLGGNKVSFNDDAAVQGRLGLRVGTSTQLWPGLTAEPFVIGSLWGNLSNDNQATLVSTGTSFHLEDKLEDVWGEASAGVNFFNPTANTSVFAKVDVTFGDNIDGVGGKAGMRVSW